jgi:hypothetical protein
VSGPRCEATTAEFVRWVVQCPNAAVGIIDVDGDEYWACAEHGAEPNARTRVPSTSEGEGA